MIYKYAIFDTISGLPLYLVLAENSTTYTDGTIVDNTIIKAVPDTILDEVILTTWHWTGAYLDVHAAKPGDFYLWNNTTFSYEAAIPVPTITGLVVVPSLRSIDLSWTVSESTWVGIAQFNTEIYTNTVDNFGTATLLATVPINSFTHGNTDTFARYYWLRAVWDGGVGAEVRTALVTPDKIVTEDITPNAVITTTFGTSGDIVAGTNAYIGIFSATITNSSNNPMPIFINFFIEQSYTAGAVATRLAIADITLSTYIHITPLLTTEQPIVSIAASYVIPANTSRVIGIFWAGADSTVSLTGRSINILGFKS